MVVLRSVSSGNSDTCVLLAHGLLSELMYSLDE